MHALSVPAGAHPDRAPRLLAWLALFWLFTYVMLTLRAQLEFGAGFEWLHEKRAVGVTAGAALFGTVLWIADRVDDSRARAALMVLSVLPAAVLVLAARSAFDHYVLGGQGSLTGELGWIIVWAGYFGLSVGVYLALQRRIASSRAAAAARAAATPVAAAPGDWEWMVDALADEMAATRGSRDLLASLRERAGYLRADETDPATARHNARVRLVERLAARVEP